MKEDDIKDLNGNKGKNTHDIKEHSSNDESQLTGYSITDTADKHMISHVEQSKNLYNDKYSNYIDAKSDDHKKDNKASENTKEITKDNRSFADKMGTKVEKKIFNTTVSELMEVGVQFGHKPRYTHPTMKKHIFDVMNGVSIINLDQTIKYLEDACLFLENISSKGGKILWVGIKKNIKDQTTFCAKRSGGFYINYRWTPGLLTNFETLRLNLQRRNDLQKILEKDALVYTKKERLLMERQIKKIDLMYGGLKDIEGTPKAIIILDAANQGIAIKEANKIGVLIIAITDSNCNIEGINYRIPGNDDALKSVKLISDILTDFIISGVSQKINQKPSFKEGAKFDNRPHTDNNRPFDRNRKPSTDRRPIFNKDNKPDGQQQRQNNQFNNNRPSRNSENGGQRQFNRQQFTQRTDRPVRQFTPRSQDSGSGLDNKVRFVSRTSTVNVAQKQQKPEEKSTEDGN